MIDLFDSVPERLLDQLRSEHGVRDLRSALEESGLITDDPVETRHNMLEVIFGVIESENLGSADLETGLERLQQSSELEDRFVGYAVAHRPEFVRREFVLQCLRKAERQLLQLKRRLPGTWRRRDVWSLREHQGHLDEIERIEQMVAELAELANDELEILTGRIEHDTLDDRIKMSIYAYEIQSAKARLEELLRAARQKHGTVQKEVLQLRTLIVSTGILITGVGSMLVSTWVL